MGLALLGLASPLFAQNQDDALRYSRLQFGGPARTQAIGGANVALGGDLGNLTSNPAGLGLFQRSEFNFSPGLGLGNADARATNVPGAASLGDSRNSLHLANASLAFSSRRPDNDNSDWRGGTLALGFTRVNDFNTRFAYRNNLPDSRSLFQRFREPRTSLDDIEGQDLDGAYTTLDGLAYGTYLSDFGQVNGQDAIVTPGPLQRTSATQEESVLTTGSQTQFDIGYGGSYQDKLYVGAAIGIVSTRFNSTSELRETDENNSSRSFGSLTLRDELRTRGTGYNARLGLIYRPLDWVRVGLSAQTPTAFQLDDAYSTSLAAQFRQPIIVSGESISASNKETEEGRYSYRLTTPWRLNGGLAFIIAKYGFVSADAELVDYSQARLRNASELQDGDTYSFSAENSRIDQLYKQAVNVRLGAEARFDAFRVRAGYARYGDPYRDSRFDRAQTYYTGGVGLRQNNISLDLAGVYTRFNRVYSPYTLADGSQPEIKVTGNRLTTTLSLGYHF
ncbi:outer membrane protein transport protein [Hymenobacter coalescens]